MKNQLKTQSALLVDASQLKRPKKSDKNQKEKTDELT